MRLARPRHLKARPKDGAAAGAEAAVGEAAAEEEWAEAVGVATAAVEIERTRAKTMWPDDRQLPNM